MLAPLRHAGGAHWKRYHGKSKIGTLPKRFFSPIGNAAITSANQSNSRRVWNVPIGTSQQEHFGWAGIVSPTRSLETTQVLGLSLALLLFGRGIWAIVGGGSLSQNNGAWVSQANR
jgi:hypothetical protein